MDFKCEKHIGCVVIHQNIDRRCPFCRATEEYEDEIEEASKKLGSLSQDYHDLENENSALQDLYYDLKKKFKKILKG